MRGGVNMLKPVPFAHAVTVVTAVFYVICAALSLVAPDLLFSIVAPWFHSINIEAIKVTTMPSMGTLLIGLITISVVTWVTTYATIELYNRLTKGK